MLDNGIIEGHEAYVVIVTKKERERDKNDDDDDDDDDDNGVTRGSSKQCARKDTLIR